MCFAHAVCKQRLPFAVSPQRSLTAVTLVAGFATLQSASVVHGVLPKFGSIVLHGSGPFGSSLQYMSNVRPATWSWVWQPRVALFAETKSSVSWISCPDRYITTIVFSNGNTLNMSSLVKGPR